jgi:HD-like signal output (HDOD) protein
METPVPNDVADDFVSNVNDLPNLGSDVGEMLALLDNPNANFPKIAKLVKRDPIISAKVLRVANSAYYYSGQSVGSLETAMSRLGMNELRNIALASSMIDTFSKVRNTLDTMAFWRHCLGSANASTVLAKKSPSLESLGKDSYDSFYTCGLLHHLGILLEAWVAPYKFQLAMKMALAQGKPLYEMEKTIFGFNHAEAGAALLRRWKFPELMVESALYHHHPEEDKDQTLNWARVTHLSAMLCNGLEGQDSFEGDIEGFDEKSFFSLGLNMDTLPELNNELREILEKSGHLAGDLVK